MKLVRLTPELEPAVREIAAEYAAAGMSRFEDVERDYPAMVERFAQAEHAAASGGRVPFTWYLAQRDDGLLVGTVRLRHALSPALEQNGGHIGYDVRPSMRNRGYATRMVSLAVEKARARGIREILFTVDPDNAPSIRVLEKIGARRGETAEETGYLRYRLGPGEGA